MSDQAQAETPTSYLGLSELYEIREALGFNRLYPLSHLAGDARRILKNRDEAVAALKAFVGEHENLEDRAPVEPECGVCNLGTGPHKRTCAYHQARAVIRKVEAGLP